MKITLEDALSLPNKYCDPIGFGRQSNRDDS
jgi:hypothetical protein